MSSRRGSRAATGRSSGPTGAGRPTARRITSPSTRRFSPARWSGRAPPPPRAAGSAVTGSRAGSSPSSTTPAPSGNCTSARPTSPARSRTRWSSSTSAANDRHARSSPMSSYRLLLVLPALLLVGFAPAPFPRKERAAARDDREALQGMWKMTEQAYSGKPTPASGQARVKGDTWTFVNSGRDGPSYTLTLDQTVSPRALEWKSGGSVWVASYKLEGRKLTIIYTSGSLRELQKRPTDFNGTFGNKMVYERE